VRRPRSAGDPDDRDRLRLRKIPWTKAGESVFFRDMTQTDRKHVTPGSLLLDFVLVVGFFAYMFTVLRPHVQSNDPFYINLWGALGSACMSSVFWLAVQMFRVVYRAQRDAKK
jgi:hypothetical protein